MESKSRIKVLRKELGLTQKAVYEKLGIPTRTQQGWENGEREPAEWLEEMILREYKRIGERKMIKPRSTGRIDRYGNEILEGERVEISNGMAYEDEDDYPIAIVKYDKEKELFKVEFQDGSYADLNDICHNDMVLI